MRWAAVTSEPPQAARSAASRTIRSVDVVRVMTGMLHRLPLESLRIRESGHTLDVSTRRHALTASSHIQMPHHHRAASSPPTIDDRWQLDLPNDPVAAAE